MHEADPVTFQGCGTRRRACGTDADYTLDPARRFRSITNKEIGPEVNYRNGGASEVTAVHELQCGKTGKRASQPKRK